MTNPGPGNRLLFICYHAVSPTWRSPLSVTPETLGEQLESLARRGYRSGTFSEAITAPPRDKTVVITFDDAFLSVYRHARPVLDRLGMVATLFAPTSFIDSDAPMSWPGVSHYAASADADEMLPMRWSQIRELAAAGWEIGSHTCTHPRLTRLDDDRLESELVRSREICERQLEMECTSIAYPYGDADDRVLAAARAAGYGAGCTLMDARVGETALSRRRIGLHETDGALAFRIKTAGVTQRLWRSPAWPFAERLVRLIRRSGRQAAG